MHCLAYIIIIGYFSRGDECPALPPFRYNTFKPDILPSQWWNPQASLAWKIASFQMLKRCCVGLACPNKHNWYVCACTVGTLLITLSTIWRMIWLGRTSACFISYVCRGRDVCMKCVYGGGGGIIMCVGMHRRVCACIYGMRVCVCAEAREHD